MGNSTSENPSKQHRSRKKRTDLYVDSVLLQSAAFRKLAQERTGVPILVILEFFRRRTRKNMGTKRNPQWVTTNSGEICFLYSDAEKMGITARQFTYALDRLLYYGFTDVTSTQGGRYKVATLYAESDRWKRWGKDDFIVKSRNPRTLPKDAPRFEDDHEFHPKKHQD